jgi:hypothetical protein
VDALRDAEVALAKATAPRLAAVQLSAEQLRAFIARGGVVAAGRGGRGGVPFYPTQRQMAGLQQMNAGLASQSQAATTARTVLLTEAFGPKPDAAAIRAKADALGSAELSLAKARGDAFAKIQASPHKLSPEGVAAVAAAGGAYRTAGLGFTMPEPIDFNDHEGYISLFDGVSLKGWDGNPKFWSVKDGAIFGESTPQNPSGNNYIVYRDIEAKDFTLKFEVKVEGTGGTGIQYRSKTGLPWLANIAPEVTANVGPVNLKWMMTGPQADFWPSARDWTGQFYSENTPMRILAWRGQVVEGAGSGDKRLMGNIGDREALGKLAKANDWNQFTVIARSGTFIHILNGQLMAVMVDDDPTSSNNQPGLFGIEIEATTRVWVRNMWLKKIN